MSKEAMQAAAAFAASGQKRKDGKPIPASWILCVTWMAYYSRDHEAPYGSRVAQKTLAALCQVADTRAVAKMLDGLEALKIVTRGEKEGRYNTYQLHLPSSSGDEGEHLPSSSGDEDATPAPQYPYQVPHPPSRAAIENTTPALQAPTPALQDHDTGPPGPLLPYKERLERLEREETRVPARVREDGEMGEPTSITSIWTELLQYVRDHIGESDSLNGYDVEASDVDQWATKIRPTMPGPYTICFRGPRELVNRGSVFRGVMSGVITHLYDGHMLLDYWAS